MNNYLIKSHHLVLEDNFGTGEGNPVNGYMLQGEVTAPNLFEAVRKYYENFLYYTFEKDNICDNEDNEHYLHDNISVDVDNAEVIDHDIEEWKAGRKKLFINSFTMEIFELIPITTDKFFEKPEK